MGNDPVNLIDPSGGVGIPCPGTSQLALFFMKAGKVALNALNTIGSVSTVVSNSIQVASSAANIYNWSLQYRIISQQLVGNATGQVGGKNSLISQGLRGKNYLFNSPDEAAFAWGLAYNDNSIVDEVEFGSTIYEVYIKGKRYFKYSIPNKAFSRGSKVPVSQPPNGEREW